jgi:uncharacterized protein
MRPNRFLENAWKGIENPTSQVLAIGLTWLIFFVIGGSVMLIPVGVLWLTDPARALAYMADPMNFSLLGIDMILVFVMLMGQFLVGLGGLWLVERTVMKKKFIWLATGFKRFRFRRMLAAMGLWMGLMAVYQLVTYLIDPSSVTLTVDMGRFLIFLPIAIVLVPLQSAFEELAVRGQLMQGLARLAPRQPYLPLFLSALIFAILHVMNKEVQVYGAGLMMAHYFTFGLVLGAFALIDEGLEISIGIHAGNNVFSLVLVSYPASSVQTPSLLVQGTMTAMLDFVVLLVLVVLVYFIFFGRRKNAWTALVDNVSTSPAQPEDALEKVSLDLGE